MTKTQTLHIRPTVQQGFTLVELMVSVTISLVLVLFVSSLFISSKSSYRLNDDSARMQEDGRYAMGLIGRSLMQAGFGDPGLQINTSFVNELGKDIQGLRGCTHGFVDPAVATNDLACATAGDTPAFHVSYWVDDAYDSNTGAGEDCNGQNVSSTAKATSTLIPGIASNRFYLYTKPGDGAPSLYCNGSGNVIPQPVLSNVEDMVVTYGVSTGESAVRSEYMKGVGNDVDNFFGDSTQAKKNWKKVVSVEVCLLISSGSNVTSQAQKYYDCSGSGKLITAPDRKLRRAITSVFTLRNNADPSLVRG